MDQCRAFKTHQPVCLNKTTSFPWVPSTLLEIYITIVDPGTSRISDPPRFPSISTYPRESASLTWQVSGEVLDVIPSCWKLTFSLHFFGQIARFCHNFAIPRWSWFQVHDLRWRQFFCLSLVLLRSFVLMDGGSTDLVPWKRRLGGCGTSVHCIQQDEK